MKRRRLLAGLALALLAAGAVADASAQEAVSRPRAPKALTLREAVERGLQFNLGTVNVAQLVQRARGQRTVARSALLPTLLGDLSATVQQLNLAAMGFQASAIPDFSLPSVVGPFHYVDFRVRLSQNLFDLSSWNRYRGATEALRATELSAEDARDVVVLAVAGTYLQVIASRARVESVRAQLETANVLFRQTSDRRGVGLVAQVDVDRGQIQVLTQQQRLTALQNELAKEKIDLLQMIGLQPTDEYELADDVPYSPAPVRTVDEALREAREHRADLQALEAQVRAAERELSAVRAQRLPSVSVSADYGAIGSTPRGAESTFSLVGRVRVPLWQGARTAGETAQAAADVAQRKTELDDLSSRVEADVRKAFLDLQAASVLVDVSRQNVDVTRQALDLTRQRFDAGLGDNVELVQAQESVAAAAFDYINSVFAHNLGKLNVARVTGRAAEQLPEFLRLQ
jgi:outer membrane protein TolC